MGWAQLFGGLELSIRVQSEVTVRSGVREQLVMTDTRLPRPVA